MSNNSSFQDYFETIDSLFSTNLSEDLANSGMSGELDNANIQLASFQDSSTAQLLREMTPEAPKPNPLQQSEKRRNLASIQPEALLDRFADIRQRAQQNDFQEQLSANNATQRSTNILAEKIGWLGNGGQSTMEHLLICSCAYCHNPVFETPEVERSPQPSGSAVEVSQALAALPLLSSNPNADAKIYLDFNGHVTSNTYWNSKYKDGQDFTTPAYDTDSDTSTFSSSELGRIEKIWQRVAEDYAPFNVDITTIDPGDFSAKSGLRVVIGGSSKSWFGKSAGGVAFINSWRWSSDTPVYVFENQLGNGNIKYTAEAISHEVGHALGLYHQSSYSASGEKTSEYYSGSGKGETGWAPIMGNSYSKNLTTWHNGTNSKGSESYQDELAIIASDTNGFGYRADDHGNTNASATQLIGSETVSGAGIISTKNDVDVFSFQTGAGDVSFDIDVATEGANLDIVAELYQGNKRLLRNNPTDKLDASLSTFLEAGTYSLHIKSNGDYGRLGQYTLQGNINPLSQPDPILSVSDVTISEGNSDEAQALVTVELNQPSSKPVAVKYTTVDGSAIAAEDYVAQNGTLTFNPGQTRQTIAVDILGDLQAEDTETFSLQFSQATNGQLSDPVATVAILDDDVADSVTATIAEIGRVEAINHQQQTIVLDQRYTNPVVFAQPLSRNGGQTATVRIDNIQSDRFTASIQEPGNLDNWHTSESFSYLVVEAGTWQLADGTFLEAGTLNTNATTTDAWATVNWETDFDGTPVVLSNLQTDNDADFMNLRQKNIGADGFQVALEKEEALKGSSSATETVGWLAISSGQGQFNDLTYEAGYTGDTLTHRWHTLNFEQSFAEEPKLLASISSFDGGDPVGLRYEKLTTTGVKLMLDEDTSRDTETDHTSENVGYLAIEGSGLLTGQAIEPLTGKASTAEALVGEADILMGSANSDRFTLRPKEQSDDRPYLIVDFDPSQDMIQLYGSADAYTLRAASGMSGTAIYHTQQDELVGVVAGETLGLDSLSFIS
ncbi:MAG: Calx-beta domain-containing protein [Cyanophyceae cyanobacterium]